MITLGAGLLIAGAAIAPAYATVYAMVERAAPQGTLTEAFAWLASAAAVAEVAGPEAAFGLAGAAGTSPSSRPWSARARSTVSL